VVAVDLASKIRSLDAQLKANTVTIADTVKMWKDADQRSRNWSGDLGEADRIDRLSE